MEKMLESRLRKCLANPETEINMASYRQTLLLAKGEAQRKAERKRAGFGNFLVWHMQHSGVQIWLVQAGLLACIGFLLLKIYDSSYFMTQRRISMLLCGLAVLIFMTALPVFYRSSRYKMLEIEAATRTNAARIFLAEMLTITIGDAVMISTAAGITVIKASYGISSALLYLAVPFLALWCVVIRLLWHVEIKKAVTYCSVICFCVLLLIILLNEIYPACYEQSFSVGWAGICAGLLFVCIYQMKGIMKQPDMVF